MLRVPAGTWRAAGSGLHARRLRLVLGVLAVLALATVAVPTAAQATLQPLGGKQSATPQQQAATPQPANRQPSSGGSGGSGVGLAIGIGAAALVLLAGTLLVVRSRRRPHPSAGSQPPVRQHTPPPAPRPPAPPSPPVPPAPTPVRSAPTATDVLRGALAAVGRTTSSVAVQQQIERLLGRPASRDELVAHCIAQRDQAAEPENDERLMFALAEVGVHPVWVHGVPFDAQRHESIGRLAAPSAQQHDTVALTEQVGYIDGERILRLPKVVVYRAELGPASGAR
jgi:hypothetical protein